MSVASFEVISESISVLYDTITTGEEQQQRRRRRQQQQWLKAVTAAASRHHFQEALGGGRCHLDRAAVTAHTCYVTEL